jgi:uncharacterized protein YidB (DUF937 family)
MGTLDPLMQKYGDDVNGLVEKLRSSGLGDKVESWIGTGQNDPACGQRRGGSRGGGSPSRRV